MAKQQTVAQIVANVWDRYTNSGSEFYLKQVADDAYDHASNSTISDDLLRNAIDKEVKRNDKEAHQAAQLSFGPWSYGSTLNLGEGERIGTENAVLEHVIRDDELFDANWKKQQARKAERDSRTRALLPYLSRGMTVGAAIAAWQSDHPDEEPLA